MPQSTHLGATNEVARVRPNVDDLRRQISEERQVHLEGVAIEGGVLRELLDELPRLRGTPVLRGLSLRHVTVIGECNLSGIHVLNDVQCFDVHFEGSLILDEASIWGNARFMQVSFRAIQAERCRFLGNAEFHRSIVIGTASFDGTLWKGDASFTSVDRLSRHHIRRGRKQNVETFTLPEGVVGCRFDSSVSFDNCTFSGWLHMRKTSFGGRATFLHCKFNEDVQFVEAEFEDFALFNGSTFAGEANYVGTRFLCDSEGTSRFFDRSSASFHACRFKGEAHFSVRVEGHANFISCRFDGECAFTDSSFRNGAQFNGSVFAGPVGFHMATFVGSADFADVDFQDGASFSQTGFGRYTRFSGARFHALASFWRAYAEYLVTFDRTRFSGTVDMSHAKWTGGADLRTAEIACKRIDLTNAVFGNLLQMTVTSPEIDLRRTRMTSGGQLHLGPLSAATFEDADVLAPLIISATDPSGESPRILSLCRTNAANFTLEGMSLADCCFLGAISLDKLRIGGGIGFSGPPGWGQRFSRRETILEEAIVRVSNGDPRWLAQVRGYPSWAGPLPHVKPAQVSAIYRSLRKSREDSKDEPGGGHFYYGEMEMRRMAAPRWGVERLVLWLYWALSGYALRASRAFGGMAVLLLLAGVLYAAFGFAPAAVTVFTLSGRPPAVTYVQGEQIVEKQDTFAQRLPAGLLYSVQSGISLLRPTAARLTPGGAVVEAIHRLLTPILLGLAFLSLRGRVKR